MAGTMQVKDVMNGIVLHVDINENLSEVMGLLHRNKGDAVIVRENGTPCGIITAKQIVSILASSKKVPDQITASEVMTPLVSIEHDADVDTAKNMMTNEKLEQIPVREEYDIIGLVVPTDLI